MTTRLDGVTVVIAAYNAESTIGRALCSALSQPEVSKVILVDDCSSDNTVEAAYQAGNNSDRLLIIRHATNCGPSAARNTAFSQCHTPFIAILDADDALVPGRFSRFVDDGSWDIASDNILFRPEEAGADGSIASISVGPARSSLLDFSSFLRSNIGDTGKGRTELGFMKPVMRRSMIEDLSLRYDETVRLGEDYLFYAQALLGGARAILLSQLGYIAYVNPTSLSRQHTTQDLEALVAADDRLIGQLKGDHAQRDAVHLLNIHRNSVLRKVVTRRFLDDKRRIGMAAALGQRVRTPVRLAHTIFDLVRDRFRYHETTTQQRVLFDGSLFQGRQGCAL
jgi:succinoglycan biosynthesis protein ExoU